MTEVHFLVYLADPFRVRRPVFFVANERGCVQQLQPNELDQLRGLVVTPGVGLLLECCRATGVSPPRDLFDVDQAIRLGDQLPRDEVPLPASFWERGIPNAPLRQLRRILDAEISWPDARVVEDLLRNAAEQLAEFWAEHIKTLEANGERERLFRVEIPLATRFAKVQYLGMAIDATAAASLLAEISHRKYRAHKNVGYAIGENPTGLNFWNVQPRLIGTDVEGLASIEDGWRLRDSLKLASIWSAFAKNLIDYFDAVRDEGIVRRLASSSGRTFPHFQTMGTVTGRILVTRPLIQQIKKEHRRLIIANSGCRLAYLDFAQFEPGILAGLCGDAAFTALYNAGDVYVGLSEALFGSASRRKDAKRVFLAVCYGMSSEAVARLVNGNAGGQASAGLIDAFFNQFPGISAFRRRCMLEVEEFGRVGSVFGNFRRRSRVGPLTSKEARWAFNQPIQATASLIFKEALLDIFAEFGEQSVVLPMHDALLLQFKDDASWSRSVGAARSLMCAAFQRRFPEIVPRVIEDSFATK